ncbi:retrovirus-related Pol polyprotein from transposon opus [Trichonephila clavipes]|nr:retrovirus-related Pol polyprotein from transposon opus [Trichonephila clavipes]
MPFGLVGASGTFQREMNRILKSHSEYAQAYMDDVVIFSKTFEEHLVHLELVLAELKNWGSRAVSCLDDSIRLDGKGTTWGPEGIYRPIAFASQKFNATQKNWTSIEKEAWAVLYGLNKFDKRIYGAKVEIISDHNPLKYLNQTTPKKSQANPLGTGVTEMESLHYSQASKAKTAAISSAMSSAFISDEFPSVNTVSRSLKYLVPNLPPPKVAAPGRGTACPPLAPALLRGYIQERDLTLVKTELLFTNVNDVISHLSSDDEAHFWLNGYVNKQNCRIWSEVNPQVYVETPLHPEKLTVWCALWAGGILLQKR